MQSERGVCERRGSVRMIARQSPGMADTQAVACMRIDAASYPGLASAKMKRRAVGTLMR